MFGEIGLSWADSEKVRLLVSSSKLTVISLRIFPTLENIMLVYLRGNKEDVSLNEVDLLLKCYPKIQILSQHFIN